MNIKKLRVYLDSFIKDGKYKLKGTKTGYPTIDMNHEDGYGFFEKHPIIPSVDMITILKHLSKNNRNHPAIDCHDLKATYQELIDDSHKLYLAYKNLGVKKGDIVTISLPSNYQAIASFLALNELGAVTTFIDTYSTKEEIENYLTKYNSPLYINYNVKQEENENILKNTCVKKIVTLCKENENDRNLELNKATDERIIDFNSLGNFAKMEPDKKHLPNKGKDPALILYTSGSTGQPKAVVLTNKNILAAQMYAGNTSHTENITATKTMTCVPLRYPYGMVTSLLTSLLWGKEAIMTPEWDSDKVKYYFDKKPNIIFGSPAVLELTLKFLPEEYDLSYITHFISGGDFLTKEHAKRAYSFFEKHNNKILELGNGYGNAETVSIGSTPVGVPLKQGTAGKVLVGSSAMIIDKETPDDVPIHNPELLEEKKYYELGELCLAGEHVFREYFGEPVKTKCTKFKRGSRTYFRTGTIGYLDSEGYFIPTQRKSRFYIRSTGHKVYLDNVQHIVGMSSDKIEDCAAVKVPDEDELYVDVVYVVLKPGVQPTEEVKREIFDSLLISKKSGAKQVQLKEYEIPKDIIFIDELPRIEGSEKINYIELEKKAQEEFNNKVLIKQQ